MANAVAQHLGGFDLVLASDGVRNLSGRAKADALVGLYGERGFDYIGNARVDLAVWARARRAIVVNAPERLAAAAARECLVESHLPSPGHPWRAWIKALRLHQWLKNLLVFVPMLAAHRFMDPATVLTMALGFLAFGLCASSVYLLNDLLDLSSDRHHHAKHRRPFASGRLPLLQGMLEASLTFATHPH